MKTIFDNQLVLKLMLSGVLFGLQPVIVEAATITVCASGCDFSEVQPAIDAAQTGDTVQFAKGVYYDRVYIGKSIKLQGQNPESTILDGTYSGVINIFSPPPSIPVVSVLPGNTVEIKGLSIRNNNMNLQGNGGGVNNAGILTITNCIIADNKAAQGGGIYNTGELNVERSQIANNTADAGTQIMNEKTARIVNSAIFGSSDAGYNANGLISNVALYAYLGLTNSTVSAHVGKAIVNLQGTVDLDKVTLAKDETGDGSSILFFQDSLLRIASSIISSKEATSNCLFLNENIITSLGGNVSSDATCQLNTPTDLQSSATINLGPLMRHGAELTPTHALLPGSSAIDSIPEATTNCIAWIVGNDQRDVARPQGRGCDSGAYELRMPVANDDTYSMLQEQALDLIYASMLANDESPDSPGDKNNLVLNVVTGTANGALEKLPSGIGLRYTPNPGFADQDSFTYTVSDGIHTSQPATVIIKVKSNDLPPVAQNDSYSAYAGQALTVVPSAGVLANDSDPDGDPLAIGFYTTPDQGSLSMNDDGSFTYTPNPGFTGTDSFSYKAFDGRAYSADATVTIEVKPATGTITIIEDAQPDSPADFSFTGDLGNFILDNPAADDGDLYGNSQTFEVAQGTYTVNQTPLAGWFTGSIICNPLGNTAIDTVTNSVQITIGLGENKTCTFVNQPFGRVKAKVFNDLNKDRRYTNNEPGLLSWKTMLLNPATGKWLSRLTNSNGDAVFANLKPNVYTVCEVLQTGWLNTVPAVVDPIYKKPCRKVTVSAGKTVTALFGNSR